VQIGLYIPIGRTIAVRDRILPWLPAVLTISPSWGPEEVRVTYLALGFDVSFVVGLGPGWRG
jgi:hypothetical protein